MNEVSKEVAKLRMEAASKVEEAERLLILEAEFPGLKKHTNRWNRVRFVSPAVNSKADQFDQCHNCGCCEDSPLEVWPYLETPHGRVYSDPPYFRVGEKTGWSTDRPYPGWDEEMRKAGIQEPIIERVRKHFQKSEEDEYDD